MNNLNIPEDKLGPLLNMVGQKLGKDPQQLQKELQDGKLDNVLSGVDSGTANKVNGLLKDPKALEAMLSNDKVKNMLNGLLGGGK